jgi:hypothetical protein
MAHVEVTTPGQTRAHGTFVRFEQTPSEPRHPNIRELTLRKNNVGMAHTAQPCPRIRYSFAGSGPARKRASEAENAIAAKQKRTPAGCVDAVEVLEVGAFNGLPDRCLTRSIANW